MRIRTALLLLGAASLAGACVGPDEDIATTEDEIASPVMPIPGKCTASSCGVNRAKLAPFVYFHELQLGVENAQGVTLESFTVGNENVKVYFDEIIADVPGVHPAVARRITQAELMSARMVLAMRVQGEGGQVEEDTFTVRFRQLATTDFVRNPSTDEVTYWRLEIEETGQELCNPGFASGVAAPMSPYYATLFSGDRYNLTDRTVSLSSDGFNVACAGTPMARMHLERRTTAGQLPGTVVSLPSRQERFTELTVPPAH